MADELTKTDPEQEREDSSYLLDRQAVARIIYAVDIGDQALLWQEMEPLHAADIADLLEQINAFDRRRLIELYGTEFDGDILSELDEGLR
ncbi:MAG: magnesium transporter, partial [Rhodobacteraceae bacterium]|nr:magnesium transporter [Paracoccaceae bacterium]